jgi:uncharacterized protein
MGVQPGRPRRRCAPCLRPDTPPATIATLPAHADISVRLTPRAARDDIAPSGDGYAARVTAPPVDDRANHALCRLIAKRAGVAPSRVAIVRGHKARDKVVRVEGIDDAALRERLRA